MIDKAPINNPHLSLRAKGLLAYLLSKPPDWRPQTLDICAHCKESPAVVRSAMQELAKSGHAVLIKESGVDGRMDGSRWAIYENPQTPNEIKVSTEITVFRTSEKRHPNNNDKTNKNEKTRQRSFEDFKNWPPKEAALRIGYTREVAIDEATRRAVILLGDQNPFLPEWKSRIIQAPYRSSVSLSFLEEDICAYKAKAYKSKPIRNPGGRANWYFMNLDLDSPPHGVGLKSGCRGKQST